MNTAAKFWQYFQQDYVENLRSGAGDWRVSRGKVIFRDLMKKPTYDERRRMCTGKRRYHSQGDALDAARVVGVERQRKAYVCPICRFWHLTSI